MAGLSALTSVLDEKSLLEFCARLDLPPRLLQRLVEGRVKVHRLQGLLRRRHERGREPRPSELYHWLQPLALEQLLYLFARCDDDELRRWLSRFVTQLRDTEPHLDGNDLAQLGFPPGPLYKTILAALLDARLDGRIQSRSDAIALARKRFASELRQP
jgi:tRNA nucleotidyltransferase (CCA-adding enzyme)